MTNGSICVMKFRKIGILSLLLLSTNLANATHHLFYVTDDGKTVYVASDTERTVRNPDAYLDQLQTTACKVVATRHEVLVISGKASHTVAIKQEDGGFVFKTDHEFRPVAARILNKNESADQQVTDLLVEASKHIKTMMILDPEAAKAKDLASFFDIRVTMVVDDRSGPRIWDFVIPVVNWKRGPEKPYFYPHAHGDLVPPRSIYKVNVYAKDLPQSLGSFQGMEAKMLTDVLSKYSKSPDTVVKLNQIDSDFILNKQLCSAPASSGTSRTNP
ncbi:hypothetical protein [Tunturiibacter gelidiferens]|uniref:hypothetical protein n=1 Tax=Tunturiibacter gelidiferens TaxID=3069689 RepID=UPI003D9B4BF5